MKNRQFLTLELSADIAGDGKSFPKSQRPEHFLRGVELGTPSPATYQHPRFLEDPHQAMHPSLSPRSDGLFNKTGISSSRQRLHSGALAFPTSQPSTSHTWTTRSTGPISLRTLRTTLGLASTSRVLLRSIPRRSTVSGLD